MNHYHWSWTLKRRLAAIMFADIVGYTAMMGEKEDFALQVLHHFKETAIPLVLKHEGIWHKDLGDGALCSFENALDAVNCAIAIQRHLNLETAFKVRIGIHLGDITYRDGDVYGDGVNIASRIQTEAAPGGICVSESIYRIIRNKEEIQLQYLGKRNLKNVDGSARLYQITNVGLETVSFKQVAVIPVWKSILTAIALSALTFH